MPDIQLRFHHDMLVLSAPIESALERQGFEINGDLELLVVTEPEAATEAIRLEAVAGAQCLVTPTTGITEARLAKQRMEGNEEDVVSEAMAMVRQFKPQHTIVEIGSTGLPIDPESKNSLVANRDQYANAVKAFGGYEYDAVLLSDLESVDDVRCALMGVRMVSDAPVFASVKVSPDGYLAGRKQTIEQVAALMEEYEANVIGVHMDADPDSVVALVERLASCTSLPIMLQIDVAPQTSRLPRHDPESDYSSADAMVQLAARLRAAGVQFLRASGKATPSYTGALAATTMGVDCIR